MHEGEAGAEGSRDQLTWESRVSAQGHDPALSHGSDAFSSAASFLSSKETMAQQHAEADGQRPDSQYSDSIRSSSTISGSLTSDSPSSPQDDDEEQGALVAEPSVMYSSTSGSATASTSMASVSSDTRQYTSGSREKQSVASKSQLGVSALDSSEDTASLESSECDSPETRAALASWT